MKDKLLEGLESLTGLDYEKAESDERAAGNNAAVLQVDAKFQLRLAAQALGENVNELKALPLKKYMSIINTVATFLFASSDEVETVAEK